MILELEQKRSIQAERMRHQRKLAGKSQAEMAELLRVDLKTYTNWENGYVDLTRDKIIKVATVLGIDFKLIWNEEEHQRVIVPEEKRYRLPAETDDVVKVMEKEIEYLKEQNKALSRALNELFDRKTIKPHTS